MAIEIERKFRVITNDWRLAGDHGRRIRQAYLASSSKNSVRIRITDENQAKLTIKSGFRGIARDEFEYEIPVEDAVTMLPLCQASVIDKVRYHVPIGDFVWEVDVFAGANAGLTIAEIELTYENQEFSLPAWIGDEVTGDLRYQNSSLAETPYCEWPDSAR